MFYFFFPYNIFWTFFFPQHFPDLSPFLFTQFHILSFSPKIKKIEETTTKPNTHTHKPWEKKKKKKDKYLSNNPKSMGTRTHKMSTPWSPFHVGQLLLWMEPSLGVWLIDPVTLLWRKLLFCFPETFNQLQIGPWLGLGLCILPSVLVNSVESCGYCRSLWVVSVRRSCFLL